MRLTIRDHRRHFNRQTHAYAEYRAFACLAGHGQSVAGVTVTLTRAAAADEAGRCAISVTFTSGEVVGARAAGSHIYAAIDRAVRRLARRAALSE